jgi:MFS family permease
MAVLVADARSTALSDRPARPAAWTALGLLFFAYAMNYLDRSLIYILFEPIRKELLLSDTQLALLGSTSFVLFYTVLGVPFGRLADRISRKHMIAAGLVIWSVFSGLTGFMESFWGIFLCRMMVGVGEATLGPAALSMLSDLFPPAKRATVGAWYSAGVPLGAGLALFLGGAIAQTWGWRTAFLWLGFPGVALALAMMLLPEPLRGSTERSAATGPSTGVLRRVAGDAVLQHHHLGYALFAFAANGLGMWVPSFLAKVHHHDLATVGAATGACAVAGGLVGSSLGGVGADRMREAGQGGRMRFAALCAVGCAPLWLGLLHAPSLVTALPAFLLLMAGALVWLGPAAADVQDRLGARDRGVGIGIYFLVVNAVGYGFGPPLVGRLNDALGASADPTALRTSLLVFPVACCIAAAVLWQGARVYDREGSHA